MRIGVIGATGKAGQVILTELKERGFETLAIVRSPEKLANDVSFFQRDILAITKEDLAPLDVVISAFGAKLGEQAKHLQIVRHFQALLKDTNKRLIIVGSGGFLYLDNQREKKVYDKIRLVKKRSKISEQSYDLLKSSQGFEWTYMAPPIHFVPNESRTGSYQTGTNVALYSQKGKSEISYQDYATALVDEIENRKYLNSIVTVSAR